MTTLEELLKKENDVAKAPIDRELVKPIEKTVAHKRLQLGSAKPAKSATVDDEVAALLSGKEVELTGNMFGTQEPAPEEFSETDANSQLAALLSQPAVVVQEAAGELAAPEEFAHPAQIDKFDASSVENLRASLEVLADNINDKDVVGDAVYNLMINLQKDEKFRDQLSDADLGLMVAGLRGAYGVTVQRKSSNKRKRSDASVQAAEVSNMLDSLKF